MDEVEAVSSMGIKGERGAIAVVGRGGRWALATSLGLLLLATAPLPAATVPTGYQEYFVIGREQQVWNMLHNVATSEGQISFDNSWQFWNGMNSVVSATASSDNQVIYYDHWEDGYEADLLNPVQGTTLVLGDGNSGNGRACDFTLDPRIPCGSATEDLLYQGSFVNLNSDQGLPGVTPNPNPGGACQGGLPVSPLDQRCSVPVNPRNPADIRFDGGDRIMSSGGPLSVLHPMDPLSPYIGGATEIISRQAVAAARSYSIPVGEDSYGGDGSVTEPFKYVDLDVVAFEDGTLVSIVSPGAGTVSFTLDQGQHYSSRGLIDDATTAPAITINEGTKVSTSAPIAGMIFTGGDGNFATRMYTLLPDLLHGTDYIITAPGDNPGLQGSRPLNLYILNPDPLTDIDVTVTDSVGTAVINIPANSMVDYNTGTGRNVPSGSTVRLTSDRSFWGVSAYDHQSPSNDWGHSWLARKFLTDTYTVAFAPGVNNPGSQSQVAQRVANDADCTIPPSGVGRCDTLNRSPIFVSATLDNTRVRFDLDNDDLYDLVDTDGDDCPDQGMSSDATCAPIPVGYGGSCGSLPPAGTPGNCIYSVDALQSLRAYDFTDYDNSGTRIASNKPVSVAYGQDTDQATGPDPIQDTGYTIYPINQLFLDPVLVVDKTASTTSVPTAGGVVTYTLTVRSYGFGPLTNLAIDDLLPLPLLPGSPPASTNYVEGSTLITYPNLVQETTDPVVTTDPATGNERLDWPLTQTTLGTRQVLTIQYDVAIPDSSGVIRLLTNEGHAAAELGGSTFSPFDTADVVQTDVVLTKASSATGTLAPGDTVTFSLNVSNTGATDETGVVVSDPIPPDTTFDPGSIGNAGPFTGVFDSAQNAVVWRAATFGTGTGPFALTFDVVVNPLAQAGAVIPNRGGYESAETPYFLSNEVGPVVVGPLLEIGKLGPTLLHPNEVTTFEITVSNVGASTANDILVRDPLPVNTTYVAGSMEWRRNTQPFAALTDAADADEGTSFAGRVELALASLGAGEDVSFRFRVRVDPGTDGMFVSNQATVSSREVGSTDSNLVQAPVVGGADATGHVFLDLDGNGVQNGSEPDLAGVDVIVTDPSGAAQTVTTDAGGNWLATVGLTTSCYRDEVRTLSYSGSDGSLDWSATPWTEVSDDGVVTSGDVRALADPLRAGNAFWLQGGPSNTNRALRRPADLSGLATATLSFDYASIGAEADDIVSVEVSYDGGASFNLLDTIPGADPDDTAWQSSPTYALTASPLIVRFRTSSSFAYGTDTLYLDNVSICGVANATATAEVDETDPDLPPGAILTTGNSPQDITVVPGGTAVATDVGYTLPPLTVVKTSDAGGTVVPGQAVTYTISVTNNSSTTQTGLTVTDPVPTGTTFVSASVEGPVFRVSEYFVDSGTCGGSDFTGTTCDVTLDQDLAPDYFAVVQGADGTGGNVGTTPDDTYVAVTADPFGTGGLTSLAPATDVLRLYRRGTSPGGSSWQGVLTVVECLRDCDADGFRLLDVQRITLPTGNTPDPQTGSVTAGSPWTDLNQVVLFGGSAGAGCDTADNDASEFQVCALRLSPSGTQTVNWERRRGGGAGSFEAATATVMVVEWGSAWTVQRRTITGNSGGNGADATGEYDTAAISSVSRDQTWVWGSAVSSDNGLGDGPEGILLTLGDGVNQSASEVFLAAGSEYTAQRSVEAHSLTHPDLIVDYRFKADGDRNNASVDVTVDTAGPERMALVTNGCNRTDTAYARPFFSARYIANGQVQLLRRRTGQNFPAWVQGVDFSNITTTVSAGSPPDLVEASDGYALAPGETLILTYQVAVLSEDVLSPAQTQVANTVTVSSDQNGPYQDTATDTLLFLGPEVEPNNAGYARADSTITFTHTVLNRGSVNDSFSLAAVSERGWAIELVDPDTGAVIARNSDGAGGWDGGATPSTGTLAPGSSREYELRVRVPAGVLDGVQDTVTLTGVSSYGSAWFDEAEDEITVLDSTLGSIIVTPDNSGIVRSGGYVAYSHLVINATGVADTFDLATCSSRLPAGEPDCDPDRVPEYTYPIYWDADGDGVYTPGTDIQIRNTARLPAGGSQLIFVVVDSWTGATAGDVDVAYLTAVSRNDPDLLFGAASDTTTFVVEADHDLSGGGTQVVVEQVNPGDPTDTAVHPGTLVNLTSSADRYNLDLSEANLFQVDGLLHATELWADGDGDGIWESSPVATDTDGDGTWDVVGFDTDGDGEPDIPVPGNGSVSYELRRPLPDGQELHRDYVTLTSSAVGPSTVDDSITATWVFAAVTRAAVRGLRVDPEGEVSFVTATQAGTASFVVHETADPTGLSGRERLHDDQVLAPVPDSITPILYRVPTRPVTKPYVVIEETETDGDVVWLGPFAIDDERQLRAFEKTEALMDEAGVPWGAVQWTRGLRPLSFARSERDATPGHDRLRASDGAHPSSVSRGSALDAGPRRRTPPGRRPVQGVKIVVHEAGRVEIPLPSLVAAGLPQPRPGAPVFLTCQGQSVPFSWLSGPGGSSSLAFEGAALSTDYSSDNAYVVSLRPPARPTAPLTVSSNPRVAGFTRVEREALYVPSLPEGPDPWQWDILFSGWPWPDPGWDPAAGDFALPDLAPDASGEVPVRIRLAGYSHHEHSVTATINGLPVGSVSFQGRVEATLQGTIDASSLSRTANTLSLTYVGSTLPDSPGTEAMAYLDYLDLAIPVSAAPRPAVFEILPFDAELPSLDGVDYLIVTHPLFTEQAERVAALKTADGLRSAVVETDRAYDRFSGGVVEPRAIQALVRQAVLASPGLRFVLLVGDDTFDPRDHVGIGSRSYVPTLYGRDASWGLVPSETPFADVDDDGRPDVAIGRLPVSSVAEARAVVDKIEAQADGLAALSGAHLAVSDNASETDAAFRTEAEEALALLPSSGQAVWADLAEGATAARDALLQGWQEGVQLTHYFGHGGLTEWADEQVLTRDDVTAFGAAWKPTILLTWACLSQWYVGIDGPSLNEALVLQPGGGAVASVGPSGITPPSRQAILRDRLYRQLAQGGVTLGEAILNAKRETLESESRAREVVEGFQLFGDPALVVPRPLPTLQ